MGREEAKLVRQRILDSVGFALAAGNLASTALATKASRALAVCTAFEAVPWR